jgi:RNA polymerase sigma-70 factor (ECF subfamily)
MCQSATPPSDDPPCPALFLREHRRLLRSFVRYLGLSRADAEDVLQRVAEEILKPSTVLPSRTNVRRWLRTLVYRMAADEIRERKRALFLHADAVKSTGGEADAPSPEELLASAQSAAVVREEIERLEPRRRDVLLRYEIDGEPMHVVAAALGLRLATAYNLLRLARIDLESALRRRAAEDERKTGVRSFALAPFLLAWRVSWSAWVRGLGARVQRAIGTLARWHRPAALLAVGALLLVCTPMPARGWHVADAVASVEGAVPAGRVMAASSAEVAATLSTAPSSTAPSSTAPSVVPSISSRVLPAGTHPARSNAPPPGAASAPAKPSNAPPPSAAPSGASRVAVAGAPRVERDLAVPRALIDRAQRAAQAGDWTGARAALQRYDMEAPDNPFAAVRSAVVQALSRAPDGGQPPR